MPTGDFPMYHQKGGFSISELSYTTQIQSLKDELARAKAEAAKLKAAARLMEGKIHRALQDAFQVGCITQKIAGDKADSGNSLLLAKHKHCDLALAKLLSDTAEGGGFSPF
jgi:hypothetical protein